MSKDGAKLEKAFSDDAVSDDLIVLTEGTIAEAAHLSHQRLRRWSQEFELARPTLVRELSPRNIVRLYRFEDAVEVLVVKELLERGKSIHQIRKLVRFLRDHEGYQAPLREVRFAVPKKREDREIYIQHTDGRWVGDKAPRHLVLHEVLVLDEIRSAVRQAAMQRRGAAGQTERRRGRMGSREVFSGTRIPVEIIVDYLREGADPTDILKEFPALAPADIEYAEARLRDTG